MVRILGGRYKSTLIFNGGIPPRHIESLLNDKFTITYFETPRGSRNAICMKIYLYKNSSFYTGLTSMVVRFLKQLGYSCAVINDSSYYIPDINDGVGRIVSTLNADLRPYQEEAILKSAGKPFTLISLPTGTGKTVVMAALLLSDNLNTIVVVDSQILMSQLVDDIRYLTGIECGVVGGGIFNPKRWTVAVVDSLLTGRGIDLVKNTEALYFDEAHKSGANSYKTIVDAGSANVFVRRGFSGTTYRNDSRSLLLPAFSGPITMHKSTSEMINSGWLAIPHISMPKIMEPDCSGCSKQRYNKLYSKTIIENVRRNQIGTEMLAYYAEKGCLSLGLFRNVAKHLPMLKSLLFRLVDPAKVGIIHGNIALSSRRKMLEDFANHDKLILLASCGTVGEGIDLPGETKLGINFVGGCSEILIRQMLGRMLRKPKNHMGQVDQSKKFHISYIDFFDQTHPEMERQSQMRFDIYNSESAFDVEAI
jgi:superfamily II DNA or RNA helicase